MKVADAEVYPERNLVQRDGVDTPLTPRSMDVLVYLAARPGETVTAEQLLDAIWESDYIADNAVHKAISEIRQALGDDAKKPRYIRTVRSRGYLLVADVLEDQPVPDPSRTPRRYVIPLSIALLVCGFIVARVFWPAEPQITSIAVLPFENLNADADQQWLSDGMTAEAIDMLSRISEFRVVARSPTLRAAALNVDAIGGQLDARFMVEGKVLRADERLRVNVRLVRVADGATLWSARFDEPLEDVFGIQTKVAVELAEALHDEFGVATPSKLRRSRYLTTDVRAYELIVKGYAAQSRFSAQGLHDALRLYLQASTIDPTYGQAYASIGSAYYWLWILGLDRREAVWADAKTAAQRALQLDPDNGDAHVLLGDINLEEGDWSAAQQMWEKGLALSPGHGHAHGELGRFLLLTGRVEQARVHILRAVDLDPEDQRVRFIAGLLHVIEGDYQAAFAQYEQGGSDVITLWSTAYAHHKAGDDVRAGALLLRIPDGPLGFERHTLWPARPVLEAAFDSGGFLGVQRAVLDHQIRDSGDCTAEPITAALLFAILGESERMFHCLAIAQPANATERLNISGHPAFDAYRQDPRFVEVVRRVVPRY